jgi:antitoxin CptB
MDTKTRIRQLTWRSKRGLLELELLLLPFVQDCLAELSRGELDQYARLLELDDLELYDWLRESASAGEEISARQSADQSGQRDPSLLPILERIRQCNLP